MISSGAGTIIPPKGAKPTIVAAPARGVAPRPAGSVQIGVANGAAAMGSDAAGQGMPGYGGFIPIAPSASTVPRIGMGSLPVIGRGAVIVVENPVGRPPSKTVRPAASSATPKKKSFVRFSAESTIPENLRDVRQYGIISLSDVPRALDYLACLSPELKNLIGEFRKSGVKIAILGADEEPDINGYMEGTINGLVDRTSDDFGEKVVVKVGATPDTLLHEILHAVPLRLANLVIAISPDAVERPDPSMPFARLRATILKNFQFNEAISFSGNTLVFKRERVRGVIAKAKDFYEPIKHTFDAAGVLGVTNAFTTILPQYTSLHARASIITALILKTSGRTQFTVAEEKMVFGTMRQPGFSMADYVRFLQGYLAEYVRENDIDVPPDMFSIETLIRRLVGMDRKLSVDDRITLLLDSIFSQLESSKARKASGGAPAAIPAEALAEPVWEAVPPANFEAVEKLAAVYAKTVDRFLDNPPAVISREEMTALISYIRLADPAPALNIVERLEYHMGPRDKDLMISLGLILYEKGFREKGKKLVSDNINLERLVDAHKAISRVMGFDAIKRYVHEAWTRLSDRQRVAADRFRAMTGPDRKRPWVKISPGLLEYPEVMWAIHWERFGVGEAPDVSGMVSEFAMFAGLAKEMCGSADAGIVEFGQALLLKLSQMEKQRFAALVLPMRIMGLRGVHRIAEDRSAILKIFSADELEEIFADYSGEDHKILVTVGQFGNAEPWKYPEVAEGLLRAAVAGMASPAGVAGSELPTHPGIELNNILMAYDNKGAGAPSVEFDAEIYDEHYQNIAMFLPSRVVEEAHNIGVPYTYIACHESQTTHLSLLLWGTKLRPDLAEQYFEKAHVIFREELSKLNTADKMNGDGVRYLDWLTTYATYFLLQALHMRNEMAVSLFFRFLLRDIPEKYVPDDHYEHDDEGLESQGPTIADNVDVLKVLPRLEWQTALEKERVVAVRESRVAGWTRRLKREVLRGGKNLTVGVLSVFVDRFIREGVNGAVVPILKIMTTACLMNPTRESIARTVEDIHRAPISIAEKDNLLYDLLRRLLRMINAVPGANLGLMRYADGIVLWHVPFEAAEDAPYYRKTEDFILSEFAKIDELVNPDLSKDDRTRLSVFAAAGLPLQRHRDFIRGRAVQTSASSNDRESTRRLSLPHPFDIPATLGAEDAESILRKIGTRAAEVLSGGSEEDARFVCRIFTRIIASELSNLITKKAGGRNIQKEVSLENSRAAQIVISWIERQYKSAKRSPHLQLVQRALFRVGQETLHRGGVALQLFGLNLTREERRRVFEDATNQLLFSKRVKRIISQLQIGSDAAAEEAFYRTLLTVHYQRHPRNMPSDYFVDRLYMDAGLREEYEQFIKDGKMHGAVIMAEMGNLAQDYQYKLWESRRGKVENLELYVRALSFLLVYMEMLESEGGCIEANEEFITLDVDFIRRHWWGPLGEFFPLYSETAIFEVREVLEGSGLLGSISEYVRAFYKAAEEADLRQNVDPYDVSKMKMMTRYENDFHITRGNLFDSVRSKIEEAEKVRAEIPRLEYQIKLEEATLPSFITSRTGLEHRLMEAAYLALMPSAKIRLGNALAHARTDEARVLAFGRAAHMEKLMQLASIHPAVPAKYQKLFAVFQEDVSPRDPIDVQRAIDVYVKGEGDESVDVDVRRPIKEGTIGGVYRARYRGRTIALKLIPDGKMNDIDDSLRVAREIMAALEMENFTTPGSRAAYELLGFYIRTMKEEINLFSENENAAALQAVLPEGFVLPAFIPELSSSQVSAMEIVESRRLKGLNPSERAFVIEKIGSKLLPAMLLNGVFHYDLHPGNIGLTADGKIVLYDLGRVQKLTEKEAAPLTALFAVVSDFGESTTMDGKVGEIKAALQKMGTVFDEAAFAGIDSLIKELLESPNPLEALEKIYPRFTDFGFVLADAYVKLLFMYVTWNGTKKSLLTL